MAASCTPLDLGDAAWNAYGHARPRRRDPRTLVYLVDKVPEHFLGDVKVRDHTVAEGAHGNDVTRRSAHHLLGLCTDGHHLLGLLVDGNHGWLVDHDALPLHHDEGCGGAEVYTDVAREQAKEGGHRA
jgi:hypothetical protein